MSDSYCDHGRTPSTCTECMKGGWLAEKDAQILELREKIELLKSDVEFLGTDGLHLKEERDRLLAELERRNPTIFDVDYYEDLLEKIHHRMISLSEAEFRQDWSVVGKCRFEILNLLNEPRPKK